VTGLLVVVGMVFAAPLAGLFAADYAAVPGKLELTADLTRLTLPFLTLTAVAAAMMGMLNSLHHYFIPAVSPATFNVATILTAVALTPLLMSAGIAPVTAMAIGALAGGLGQVVVQWGALHAEGFRYRPRFDWSDPALRRVLMLMGPGTIGLAATQVNLFVNTVLATGEGPGAASWLSYAFRLMYLPIGLFGVSVATVVLPAAARHAALDDAGGVRQTVARGLGLMLALNVPATIGLIVLAVPIVRVLFEHGRFLPADTEAVAAAVRLYAIGLIGYSSARIVSPVFYALGRNQVPVIVSAASIGVNIVASVLLVRTLGYRGLALGTSIAALVHGSALLVLLRGALDGLEGRRLARTIAKSLAASAVMAAAAWLTHEGMTRTIQDQNTFAQVTALSISIAAGLMALTLAARALQIEEFEEPAARIRQRAWKLLGW
jgi:putative peptidoglycan lipid II flippase